MLTTSKMYIESALWLKLCNQLKFVVDLKAEHPLYIFFDNVSNFKLVKNMCRNRSTESLHANAPSRFHVCLLLAVNSASAMFFSQPVRALLVFRTKIRILIHSYLKYSKLLIKHIDEDVYYSIKQRNRTINSK